MMTKLLYTLLAFACISTASAQALVITDSATTASICFNDGTIHVAASGGTGPYTFTIISGPSYPNITYPIALAPLASTFLTIPKGQYTIKVVDASGNIAYATAAVGGTYTFPVLTPIVTSSYCIQVTVTGGRPPYQYSISSQGTNTGFGAYQSSNIFCVCTGHYWVRVKDTCSNIFTTTQINVTVPVPSINLTSKSTGNIDSIVAHLSVSSAPSYTYHLKSGALSMTNTTGIFAIPKSCQRDTVTLTDRCGQTSVAIIDPHPLNVSALGSCKLGVAVLTIDSHAIAPFTISGSVPLINTHNYVTSLNGLPLRVPYTFIVTDSCGHTVTITIPCDTSKVDTTFFHDVCPFDSALHLKQNQVNYCYPVVLTCLSCVPVKKDTIHALSDPVFTNIDTGVSYTVRIQDSCGFDYTTQYTTYYGQLSIADSIFTCSDFAMKSQPPVFVPPVHYSVYLGSTLIDSATADHPFFFHEPAGSYQVIGTHDLCKKAVVSFVMPQFGGRCVVPMFDSSCTPSYAVFQPYMASSETFTLVNTASGASYTQHQPRAGNSPLLFTNVPVGNYNLTSDSGCTVPYVLPAFSHDVTASFTSQCTGQSQITAIATPPITSCNTLQGQYFTLLKDNQYLQSNTSGIFIVSDTGYYVVRLYLSNTTIFNLPATYDTICPLDTVGLHVTVPELPNLVSVQQEVCGHHTANIPYTIFGGSAPYTVEILGYPTRTVPVNRDTFPNVYPGVYTMVVSDNCGISKSFSVAVVDTCSGTCTTQSRFTLSDTIVCHSARIGMTNQSVAASHYKWVVNGRTYAYSTDTAYRTNTPGKYTVTLYAYIGTCVDSSKRTFVVEDTLHGSAISDTFLCAPFSIKLNTHNIHSTWSIGITDSLVSISTPGTYSVRVSNSCGVVSDTFQIFSKQSPLFDLMRSVDYICDDQRDSSLLTATLQDSTGAAVIFSWSTGYVDTAYSSQVLVFQADTYRVSVTNGFCPITKDIAVGTYSCDSICLAHIAIPDAFSPNGDGKNDTFHLLHLCYIQPYEMHIYNRWGEKVFTSTDIDKGWDGKYKGEPQSEGVYWFWVSLAVNGSKPVYKSGRVTLFH